GNHLGGCRAPVGTWNWGDTAAAAWGTYPPARPVVRTSTGRVAAPATTASRLPATTFGPGGSVAFLDPLQPPVKMQSELQFPTSGSKPVGSTRVSGFARTYVYGLSPCPSKGLDTMGSVVKNLPTLGSKILPFMFTSPTSSSPSCPPNPAVVRLENDAGAG